MACPTYKLKGPSIEPRPGCTFDVKPCFKDEGLLFHIIERKGTSDIERWIFYNDTTDKELIVEAQFKEAGMKPLGRTISRSPKAGCSVCLKLSLHPGETQEFGEGEPASYSIRYSAETPAADPSTIKYAGPGPGVKARPGFTMDVHPCFKDGLLYRLVERNPMTDDEYWCFYNDTTNKNLRVETVFLEGADGIKPLGLTNECPTDKGTMYRLLIRPGETQDFLQGVSPKKYTMQFAAETPAAEMSSIKYKGPGPTVTAAREGWGMSFYPCFKEGLLFRMVEKKNGAEGTERWYFYNDAGIQRMRVVVLFEPDSAMRALGSTEVTRTVDGNEYRVIIPPHSTVEFCEGVPSSYSMKFTAL